VRADVGSCGIGWPTGDAHETHAEFLRRKGLEPVTVAIRSVEGIVLGPCQRPIIAAGSLADDAVFRCPLQSRDYGARRVRRRYSGRVSANLEALQIGLAARNTKGFL